MIRKTLKALIVDDDDLECKKGKTLEDITLEKLAFKVMDLEGFDIIKYKGSLGEKIIRFRGL